MKELIKEDYLITQMTNVPFRREITSPTVYISSDGGHGGMEKIKFCPFCGKKIKFKKAETQTITW
jgi:hypothetical protein